MLAGGEAVSTLNEGGAKVLSLSSAKSILDGEVSEQLANNWAKWFCLVDNWNPLNNYKATK